AVHESVGSTTPSLRARNISVARPEKKLNREQADVRNQLLSNENFGLLEKGIRTTSAVCAACCSSSRRSHTKSSAAGRYRFRSATKQRCTLAKSATPWSPGSSCFRRHPRPQTRLQ
ncbi:unnamed protein product, partial [Ectocarpus sp. 12 AP-2014]